MVRMVGVYRSERMDMHIIVAKDLVNLDATKPCGDGTQGRSPAESSRGIAEAAGFQNFSETW